MLHLRKSEPCVDMDIKYAVENGNTLSEVEGIYRILTDFCLLYEFYGPSLFLLILNTKK